VDNTNAKFGLSRAPCGIPPNTAALGGQPRALIWHNHNVNINFSKEWQGRKATIDVRQNGYIVCQKNLQSESLFA
jgi:hypothetical protein